ncbi:hypothetical protein JCM19235_840 [Vibrio maritimus]|uniref:Uncharacterized protein n=2 Tax=Vibrio TaxID=662 RepID=A0A090RZ43_9VIBR|nr:hypothetical protein JCM19235_840 [Vibrio maritimus]GAL26797.1 hypothetical protein JCM19239_13 [Vibrio variabilis]
MFAGFGALRAGSETLGNSRSMFDEACIAAVGSGIGSGAT